MSETDYTTGFILESTNLSNGAKGYVNELGLLWTEGFGDISILTRDQAVIAATKFLSKNKTTHCVELKKVTYVKD